MENFWQACSARLEQELTPQQYSAWIKPLVPLDFEEGRLRIAAPNRFKLDWVKTQFANRITALANEHYESSVDVQFVLDPRTNARKPNMLAPAAGEGGEGSASPEIPERMMGGATMNAAEALSDSNPRREQSRINTALTFDSFVTGKANQCAHPLHPR